MKHIVLAVLLFATTAFAQQERFLTVLKSDAPVIEKAEACRELAHIGTREAVPVLAGLLADEKLSHLARHALEPIPDASVDAALREALGKVNGRLLVGVIGSIGFRKDSQAVGLLGKCLNDPDPAVAQASARALGSIGGAAAQVLEGALTTGSRVNQPAVCEGLLRCAEALPGVRAVAIYDALRKVPNLSHQVKVAALSGSIRSRGAKGLPLLVDAIRNESYVPVGDAIWISMAMPGSQVTRALAGELKRATPESQVLLIQTLGFRGDVAAVSALTPLAKSGPSARRVMAIRSLVQLGKPSTIPLLVTLLKDADAAVSGAAKTGLTCFSGREADAAVVALLSEREAKTRITGIEAVAQRRIIAALPSLLVSASDPDATVAGASFKVLGELGGPGEIPGLVDALLQTRAVEAGETALTEVCARQADPTRCTDKLLTGLAVAKGEPRLALLRILGTLGGGQALIAVRAGLGDADAAMRETAWRVLCDWPTAEALADLARMTTTAPDEKLKSLAVRGQLRLIPLQPVDGGRKVGLIRELMPVLEQLKQQNVALAVLGTIHSPESLVLVAGSLSKEGLKEEAAVAAVTIAEKIATSNPAEVADALQQIQTSNDQIAGRVRKVLASLPPGAAEAGFTAMFNGKDLSGWSGKPGWWNVEEGALTSESTTEKPCKECNYLLWDGGQPADFELRADFRLSGSANSGIQIRSETRPNWDTYGYQADMTGDGELVGFVYHHARGLIAGRGEQATFDAEGKKVVERIGDPAELVKRFKQGDWNSYRIICRGPEITLYINGVLMCHITDHHATQAATRGIIALQMHPGPPMKVQFKNLRIKELK